VIDEGVVGLIRDGGLVVGMIVLLWLLLTEKLVPAGRLKDVIGRLEKSEDMRDEAVKGWREQAEATKEVAKVSTEAVELLRNRRSNRSE
jgi:hypothetical protein